MNFSSDGPFYIIIIITIIIVISNNNNNRKAPLWLAFASFHFASICKFVNKKVL